MRLKWQIFRKNYRVGKSLATEWRVFIVDKLFASVSIFIVYWKDCGDCRHFKQGIVSRKIYWKNRFASLKGSIAPLKELFWIRYWWRVFVQSCGYSMARTSSFQRSSLFLLIFEKNIGGLHVSGQMQRKKLVPNYGAYTNRTYMDITPYKKRMIFSQLSLKLSHHVRVEIEKWPS